MRYSFALIANRKIGPVVIDDILEMLVSSGIVDNHTRSDLTLDITTNDNKHIEVSLIDNEVKLISDQALEQVETVLEYISTALVHYHVPFDIIDHSESN